MEEDESTDDEFSLEDSAYLGWVRPMFGFADKLCQDYIWYEILDFLLI